MERHERICWQNPNRVCDHCGNKGEILMESGADIGGVDLFEPCYYCAQRASR
jgi:hypothetical protein